MPAEILDLHARSNEGIVVSDIPKQIIDGLSRPVNEKQMPTMVLYDERGLRLYDDITTEAPEYYLFQAEENILKSKADEIVHAMHQTSGVRSDEVVVELGAGALRKTSHILLGLSRLVGEKNTTSPITYYALDLELRELQRTLGHIETSEVGKQLTGKVLTKGMWGTYDDGLKFIENGGLTCHSTARDLASSINRFEVGSGSGSSDASSPTLSEFSSNTSEDSSPISTPDAAAPPLHIMFLGSSLGNFPRDEATAFLRSLPLKAASGDTLLIGLDHDNEKAKIEEAYNDPKGYTTKFILNGLKSAGRALGDEHMFKEENWEYINQYKVVSSTTKDYMTGRHEAFLKSKCSQTIKEPGSQKEVVFQKDEMMKIEESWKASREPLNIVNGDADLLRWMDPNSQYSLWLLERPPFYFPLLKTVDEPQNLFSTTPFGMPSVQEWKHLWDAWDFITRRMIPPSMLHQKPIDLRHICLFYLGHIPTFLDIHLSRLLGEPHTEPENFKNIFERGIDPDVDDPTQCHPHSEVPMKEEDWPSLTGILAFQDKVRRRVLKLYADISSNKVTLTRKVARVLFMTLEHEAMHAETLLYMLLQRAGTGTVPPSGFTSPPWASLAEGWKAAALPKSETVELGPANVELGHDDLESEDASTDFKSHEFGWDNENPKRQVPVGQFKISWRPVTNWEYFQFFINNGNDKVDMPASWVNEDGIIKVRTLYGPVSMEVARDWPVMTSYNDLSTYATVKGGRLPTEPELRLFYDKYESGYGGGSNIGFRNWHPVPATTGLDRYGGRGTNGGVWEWTSTVMDAVDGFVPSKLYPGYSMDFFDNKHQVVLGGSFATIPRIAERRSFRNWYQKNYPYAWVGGRIVYDN
ncbi:hypothetical protein CVT24_004502 [Panaeolus cyanescens]|uniref:Sulfatase-modifying factor enzyme domain-containing protein n=1 Tax=Panaeolus cyanescens TaxID=181874 RepID=A0A409YBQ5_9AGAR|nr:hypothetical protein CVT24_004502 [Panaeolus cyanescens]